MSFEPSEGPAAQAASLVKRVLDAVLKETGQPIGPASEADIQRALHLLRQSRCDPAYLLRVERISTALFTMSQARLNGRPNLHASQVQRLKRLATEGGVGALPA